MAAALGEYGATTVYDVGDLGGAAPPACPVAAAITALVEDGNAPDAILIPATYDGRDVAGRLSVKLDRPVLTNVTGLVAGDGGLSSQHPVFGGSHIVTARFTGSGPGIFVIRAKSFAAEPAGGSPATVVAAPAPDTGAGPDQRRSEDRGSGTSKSAPARSWTRRVGGGLRVVGDLGEVRRTTRSSKSWPSCCTAPPEPAAPSSTPAGCRTRTRSARRARR